LDGEGLNPKLVCYCCGSSDTCGIYATVTEAKAFSDPIARVDRIDATPATTKTVPRLPTRLAAAAPLLLAISVAARLGWTYLVPNGANFVDLHVYVGGAGALDHPGTLYDYVYADQTPDFPLPFTYPPFAAVVFYPLHLLPFSVVAFAWQLGIIAALYGVVRISQRLLPADEFATSRRVAMAWTALGIWLEPLRSTFDYGQINVLLVLAVLYAVYCSRWWLSGLLVGLAAGVKLTPAVSGLYFVGARRWATVVFSAVVFVATIGVSAVVTGDQTRYYFTELLGDASRVGPIGTSFNQSWRGGISRILGHDAGYGPIVAVALIVTAVVAFMAWRVLDDDDRLGRIVVVQLFGLLLSPISWTHHWVWVLPLMMWLLHGPLRSLPGTRILGWGWLVLTIIGVPWLLSFAQPTIWVISRPWYLAWAGLIYIVATMVTLAWIGITGRRFR
jgi:alpha-1,2-mannosyltransferase